MELIEGYHITNKANVHSILLNGLVPNIGLNSISVDEKRLLVYFTTANCIDAWIRRFHLNREDIVILKFSCDKWGRRYDVANDLFTTDSILPQNIKVIDDEEKSLEKYYEENKKVLDLEEEKKINRTLKNIIDRLSVIDKNNLTAEDGWDYNETEPNVIEIIDFLKIVSSLSDKSKYIDITLKIKEYALKKLIDNDLGITTDSEFYKLLDIIFNNALSENSNIDFFTLNLSTILLSINLYYRQVDRYNRIGKKVGDDNIGWSFYEIDEDIYKNNSYLSELLVETEVLYKNMRIGSHK